jgi:hypothetical protein
MRDRDIAQQIRIDLVLLVAQGGLRLLVNREKSHDLHQSPNAFGVHFVSLQTKPIGHLAAAEGRMPHILLVDEPHQPKVVF